MASSHKKRFRNTNKEVTTFDFIYFSKTSYLERECRISDFVLVIDLPQWFPSPTDARLSPLPAFGIESTPECDNWQRRRHFSFQTQWTKLNFPIAHISKRFYLCVCLCVDKREEGRKEESRRRLLQKLAEFYFGWSCSGPCSPTCLCIRKRQTDRERLVEMAGTRLGVSPLWCYGDFSGKKRNREQGGLKGKSERCIQKLSRVESWVCVCVHDSGGGRVLPFALIFFLPFQDFWSIYFFFLKHSSQLWRLGHVRLWNQDNLSSCPNRISFARFSFHFFEEKEEEKLIK